MYPKTPKTCVLNWIKNRKSLAVFKQNRKTEISNTNNFELWFINTKGNPADMPIRGITSKEIEEKKLWWHGSHWLKKHSNACSTRDQKHFAKIPQLALMNQTIHILKILKLTAYVFRFIDKLKMNHVFQDALAAKKSNKCKWSGSDAYKENIIPITRMNNFH